MGQSLFYFILIFGLTSSFGYFIGNCCFDNDEVRIALEDIDRKLTSVKSHGQKEYNPNRACNSMSIKQALTKAEKKEVFKLRLSLVNQALKKE